MAKLAEFYMKFVLIGFLLAICGCNAVPPKPRNLSVVSRKPSADHGIIGTLQWAMPPSTIQLKFYVRCTLDNKQQQNFQKMAKSNKTQIYLKPNSQYIIKVMAFDANNQAQGPWSNELKVHTGESVPTHAPVNVTATAASKSSILVRWEPIPQEYHSGKLLGYVVFYRKRTSGWEKQKLKSSVKFQYRLDNLPIGVDYVIAVAGYTKIGVGKKSHSVTVQRPLLPIQETSARPGTTETTTTPKYVENHIPKPTTINKLATYEGVSEVSHEDDRRRTTMASTRLPNAQANKDVKEKKPSSTGLVYKFIIPAAVGGIVMVLLIIFFLWRQRKAKRRQHNGDEVINLTTIEEPQKKKEKSRCAVTRGEGSIRYAPPPKSYTTSAPLPQDADPHDDQPDQPRAKLSVISESEPSSSQGNQGRAKQPYAEVNIANKDERYVKRDEHKPVPGSPSKSTTSEAGYENMQHLYECLDRIKNEKGSPLYVNVGTNNQTDEDGLYEEIPANRKERSDVPAVQQPLLEKNVNEEIKAECV